MGASNGNDRKQNPNQVNIKKSVKSFYIINKIFSLLSEKKKLSIIIYNKKFQIKFGYDLNYYKKISGKHFIMEKNGNRKLYKLGTNILLYGGIYKNGKKNGKGKEYNNEELIFEGEYLNGKKNGKGKEYNFMGNLIFEGEYINGNKVLNKSC